jgi:hypothetical protein
MATQITAEPTLRDVRTMWGLSKVRGSLFDLVRV